MKYANAYVSGDDTVFTEKDLGQIKPVSASSLKAKMFVNRTLLSYFDMPSASAFIQQRNKVKAEAFKAVFDGFTSNLINEKSDGRDFR
ncbi:MAG: hypothetical protein Q4B53_04555 [Lachnospiraceae bacterium]|nr:hypothetical protein [Lachnospiraceae bacterium]